MIFKFVRKAREKICWTLHEDTYQSIFRISSTLSLQRVCKISFSDSTYFELKVFIDECVTLESHEKNVLNVAVGNRKEHFQSYLSNWVRRYHDNDSATYHFQIQLISNGKFFYLVMLRWEQRRSFWPFWKLIKNLLLVFVHFPVFWSMNQKISLL